MNPTFSGANVRIGLFELSRTIVSGHHGRTGEGLDEGATLTGGSDENVVLVSGMSARPLTALDHVSLVKSTPLYFHKEFNLFFLEKNGCLNLMSQFPYNIE